MLLIEGYSVNEMLYHSGKYALYKAVHLTDQKNVILKVCRRDQNNFADLASMQHEYQILKQLHLPGIIHVYDLVKTPEELILVLEDIQGRSLHYLLNNPLDLNTFFKIAIQLVDAVGELHLKQIIHKDINPNNIIVNPKTLEVKLANFSVSTELTQEINDYNSLNIEGTLGYISPEQTGRMNRSIDYRTDFYSLGVTFYQMLTGQIPFKSDDALELVYHHLTSIPQPISTINTNVPYMVESIINKLMSKVPEKRYNSAAGLKADLINCQVQWENDKQIQMFSLGQNDIQEHLVVSQKLYGREEQIHLLLNSFERVAEGANELVFVSGYSGIGKSSLVKEIIKPIVRQRGNFLSGKYDQLQRAIPYSAIIEAFTDFIDHCMTEAEERLKALRVQLLEALGENGQVICNLIPNLELIIGPQPSIRELAPAEAQHRLMMTFEHFVRALAQQQHPLVLFLDDLQWIDNASLQLLNTLISSSDIKYFLLIGAYRDNEVAATHPLIIMQQQFKRTHAVFTKLVLEPLKIYDIENLIKDSLISSSQKKIPALASLLLEKTQGNPFFINEFLKRLCADNILKFDYHQLRWLWRLSEIRKISITDNVIDLLTNRITRLPEQTQKLLQLAACIGHTFDLATLNIISEQPIDKTAKYLLEATKAFFIIPVNSNYRLLEGITPGVKILPDMAKNIRYRFIHDKIQQAAYQLIPEATKQLVHLEIGRLLLAQTPDKTDDKMLEILNHYNYSIELIKNPIEQMQLANYNLWAGRKAKISSAYQAGRFYLEAGLKLLAHVDDPSKPDLHFALSKELAICLYLNGEYEKAEELFTQLLQTAKESLSSIEVYQLNCEMLSTLNRHEEAIRLGLKVLASFGIRIPKKPSMLHVLYAIFKIKFLIGKRTISEINLQPMESDEYSAITSLISQLLNSAFIVNQNLFVMLACTNVNLSLRYGTTDSSAFSCLVYAFTIMHGLKWYSEGLEFFSLYQNLSTKYPKSNFAGKSCFVQACFIDPWRIPLEKSLVALNEGYHGLYESGDLVYSNYCNLMLFAHVFILGKPLADVKECIMNSVNFIEKTKTKDFVTASQFYVYLSECLVNENKFDLKRLTRFELEALTANSNTEICFIYLYMCKLCYLLGYYNDAKLYGDKLQNYLYYALGLVSQAEGLFYYALALSATATPENKRVILKQLRKIRAQFLVWVSWCPENYHVYLFLIDAEIARINKQISEALNYYNEAIKEAESQHIYNLVAITYESLGRYYTTLNSSEAAKVYYKNAHHHWHHLGYEANMHLIEKLHPEWFQNKTPSTSEPQDTSVNAIDIVSLMRSAQAISGEIELEKLLQKLLVILLQNAGANRGLLLAKDNKDWYVEAEGSISEQRISLAHIISIEERTDLPLSLIRYVQRTEKPLLIQNDLELQNFSMNDNYLTQINPQSIMVIPITFHGQLQNILYLENRNVNKAFKPEHVKVLQILSSQAAISLQNARLYYQATHDSLTGLCNRNLLYQMFNLKINTTGPKPNLAIMLFDLDYFKAINDTFGHQFGDKLLIHIANLIKQQLKPEDVATRLGGDEFVVMMEYESINDLSDFAEKFLQHLKRPNVIDGHETIVTASIGISLYPLDAENMSDLLKQADMALYRVKQSGKNYFQFYTSSLDHQIKQEHKAGIELRHAMEMNQLRLYFQPVYSANTHKITHFEALVRWKHPEHGILEAKHFINTAEKTGLIVPLGRWVLKSAMLEICNWLEADITPLPIAVNISGLQFKMQNLSALIAETLQETNVDPKLLQLEFTESVSIEYTEKVLEDIAQLKALGVNLTLDDFGTYYSSLSYLRKNFVDKIKIDQSFVKGINRNKSDNDLIVAIIQLAHSLNLKVVAEGVENADQIQFLEEHGIDELQGYYLGRPKSSEECMELLKETVT